VNTLNNNYAAELLDNCNPPCLSLYQPTHRRHPDNQQDPIRFGNLVKQLEESLLQSADRYQVLGLNRHEIKLFADSRKHLSATYV
jgi:hypothetical protein